MRALDAIIGGLLLTSGLAGPVFGFVQTQAELSDVVGSTLMDGAYYEGTGHINASEAILEVQGAINLTLDAQDVLVDHEQRRLDASASISLEGMHSRSSTEFVHGQRHELGSATIEIHAPADGHVQIWPNATKEDASFSLDLDYQQRTAIEGTPHGMDTATDAMWNHEIQGPLFALGHEDQDDHRPPTTDARFANLAIEGGVDVLAANATVTVTKGNTSQTYEADNRHHAEDPTGTLEANERSLVALSLDATAGSVTFEDAQATFAAKQPNWTVNGSLTMDTQEGLLTVADSNRSLEKGPVRIQGETNLSLHPVAKKEPFLQESLPMVEVSASDGYHPPIEVQFESDAENVTIAGERVEAPAAEAVPEEVTFWSKVVGMAVLAVSILRRIGAFLLPLAIENPLANDRRRRIFDYLEKTRMAHRGQIQRATDIPDASLAHHLNVLEGHGLVVEVDQNSYKAYFHRSVEAPIAELERLAVLAHPSRRSIAERLVDRGSATQSDLTEDIDLSQSQVSRQLSRLVDESLVHQEEDDWPKRYTPSQLLGRWLGQGQGEEQNA